MRGHQPNFVNERLGRVRGLLRLQPFDGSTAAGRSDERHRRAILSFLAGGGARLAALVTLLVSVALTVRYLGPELYGVWATIISLVGFLQFSDLGLANGLVTALSEAHGHDDSGDAKILVSSALVMLAMTGVLLLLAFATVSTITSWPNFFGVTSPNAIGQVTPACLVFAATLALALPLALPQHVQAGYQEAFISHAWAAGASVVALLGIVAVIALHGPLAWLVLALTGAPLAAHLGNGYFLFRRRRPQLRPALPAVQSEAVRRLLHLGGLFFALQLAAAVGYSSDYLVIARVLGARDVTNYAVPFQMFSVVPALVAVAMAPLWPAYGEAIGRGDVGWVRRMLPRSLTAAVLVAVPVALLLSLSGSLLVRVWAGPEVHVTAWLIAGLAVWAVMNSVGIALAMFLNAMVVLRLQLLAAGSMAVTNLALSIYLAGQVGISGVIWGTVISYALCVLVPYMFFVPRIVKRLDLDSVIAA